MRTAASCAAFVFFWPRVVLLAFVTALLQSPPTPRASFGMEERPPKHIGEQVAEHLLPVDEPSRQRRRTAAPNLLLVVLPHVLCSDRDGEDELERGRGRQARSARRPGSLALAHEHGHRLALALAIALAHGISMRWYECTMVRVHDGKSVRW